MIFDIFVEFIQELSVFFIMCGIIGVILMLRLKPEDDKEF